MIRIYYDPLTCAYCGRPVDKYGHHSVYPDCPSGGDYEIRLRSYTLKEKKSG